MADYKKIFCMKYSFYALMRRIHKWFLVNKGNDALIAEGYRSFRRYVSGAQSADDDYFCFKKQGMIFSNEFIYDNFYSDLKNGKSNGIGQYMIEERNLDANRIDKCQTDGKLNYQDNNLDGIFLKGSGGKIINSYCKIIEDDNAFAEEVERLCGLVREWFHSETIMKTVIEEVIEKYFFNRKFSLLPGDDGTIIYIENGFFKMLDVIKNHRLIPENEIFQWEDFDNALKNHDGYVIQSSIKLDEAQLQSIIDEAFEQGKVLKIEKIDNKSYIILGEEDDEDYNEFLLAKRIKDQFDKFKELNPERYIANMIIMTLCIKNSDQDQYLRKIWGVVEKDSDDTAAAEGDIVKESIKKIIDPFATDSKINETLYDLRKALPDFYLGELSFLNIYIYRNWDVLHKYFDGESDSFLMLKYSADYINSLTSKEYHKYIKDYESFGVIRNLGEILFLYINDVVDQEKEELFEEIIMMVDLLDDLVDENQKDFLEAKLYKHGFSPAITDEYIQDYEKAYDLFQKVYLKTRDYSIIPLIIECLEGFLEKSGSSEIRDGFVDGLLRKWQQISLLNGDVSKINKIFREVSLDKLSERVEKIEAFSKLEFDVSNLQSRKLEDLKTNAIPEDCGEIFIILGAGRAAAAFVNSILVKENCKIFIVLQRDELKQADALKTWYQCMDEHMVAVTEEKNLDEPAAWKSKVTIVDGGLQEIYKYLELYNLDILCTEKYHVEAFSDYENRAKKIHFLALGDEKHENLKNVVDFIKVTWEHYVLYDYMVKYCSKIEVKIDFKEVDIVVDAYSFETAYIDSILNRLDKDFYLKIDYIEYKREIAKELLTEYPLFLVDMQEAKLNTVLQAPPVFNEDSQEEEERFFEAGKTKHNVVILGCNEQKDVILEVIKGILRVSGYLPIPDGFNEYLPEKAKEIEHLIGSNFSLTIVAKDTSEIEDALQFDAPDLFSDTKNGRTYLHHLKPSFVNLDPESYRFIRCLADLSQKHGIEKEEKEISRTLRDANYFICMLKDDAASYRMAIRIREEGYRMDATMKHVPVIAALCEHGFIDTDMNTFRVINDDSKEIVYRDPWWRSYDICCFGSFDRCFSYENLYTNYISEISRRVHVKFGDEDTKVRAYYKNYYNHKAGDQRAVTIPYAFYSVLYKEMCKDCTLSDVGTELAQNVWSVRIFRDNIEKYVEKYNTAIRQKGKELHTAQILWLAVLEKNRFNVNLTLEGYTSAVQGTENRAVFMRYMQGWQRRSVDGALKDKLHIAKLHGDITTWDYSKGQDYDSVYANEMGDYLLFELLREKNRMNQQSSDSKAITENSVQNITVQGNEQIGDGDKEL